MHVVSSLASLGAHPQRQRRPRAGRPVDWACSIASRNALGLLLSLVMLLAGMGAQAEDWPGWRGPRGDGSSLETAIPETWDGTTGQNIAWKVAIPGVGHGSPIVRGNRVFLVSCLPETQDRVLICLALDSGRPFWQTTVCQSALEVKHHLNSHASSTPAADDQRVYTTFLEIDGSTAPAKNVGTPRPLTPGQIVVAAHDFSGKLVWLRRPGAFASVHGFCSNPVLFENLVIVNGDHDGESYILALDRETGATVWKQPRVHQTRSYVTPLIREVGNRAQLVFSGSKQVVSLNPRTGETWWQIEGPTEQFVASPVFDGDKFYLAAGFPTYHVLAIRPDGTGDVTESHVAWHSRNAACYVPSPVVIGRHLFVADDRGTANCFDTQTGERLWQTRLGTHYSASLATVLGKAWFLADDGVTKLLEPGPEPQVVAQNPLGETVYASPAFAAGSVLIRGTEHLFRIAH